MDDADIENFLLHLLYSQYRRKWQHIMEFQTYWQIMDYFKDHYRVYVALTAIDDCNDDVYWGELIHVAFAYYGEYIANSLAMTFDDFMTMTFFCLTAELEVQNLKKQNPFPFSEDDFREVLSLCANL